MARRGKKISWRPDETRILSRGELRTVFAALERRARRSINSRLNRVIVVRSACCGRRARELCGLRLQDLRLDCQRPSLLVPAAVAKNARKRTVPLWRLPFALGHLRDWKDRRRGHGAKPSDPLLASQARNAAGRPVDRCNARRRFRVACRSLGPERLEKLTIHDGRHTCASHLLAAGWPLPNVRDMLGHANLSTTSLYSHIVVDDEAPRDPFASLLQPNGDSS